jgi:REP element-mobilizing transposase RayT
MKHPKGSRRSTRLRGFDYASPHANFVTICTVDRLPLFGTLVGGEMRLSQFGVAVYDVWQSLSEHFHYVDLDAFIVMPDHIHGVLVIRRRPRIVEAAPAAFGRPIAGSLATILGSFKSACTKRINELRDVRGVPVWQRGYYDHVVRRGPELYRIRRYIHDNVRNAVPSLVCPAISCPVHVVALRRVGHDETPDTATPDV